MQSLTNFIYHLITSILLLASTSTCVFSVSQKDLVPNPPKCAAFPSTIAIALLLKKEYTDLLSRNPTCFVDLLPKCTGSLFNNLSSLDISDSFLVRLCNTSIEPFSPDPDFFKVKFERFTLNDCKIRLIYTTY
jgi:hypothetical protein